MSRPIVLSWSLWFWLVTKQAEAAVVLPGYAQANGLRSELEQKGHAITGVLSLLVAILAIMGILVGAAHFALGNGERGRSFVGGGIIALVLASTAYAVVALVAR